MMAGTGRDRRQGIGPRAPGRRLAGALLFVAAGFVWLAIVAPVPVFVAGALVSIGLALAVQARRGVGRSLARVVGAAWGVFGAVVVSGVGLAWWHAAPPVPGAFYRIEPDPAISPGTLLRVEPLLRATPAGGRARRILYATTRHDGTAAVASAVVLAPDPLPRGPRPVVAFAHGTIGVVPGCAPSVLPEPYPYGPTVPALDALLREGWVFVATDYVGRGTRGPHPYLVGEGEARSVLDAIRAASAIDGLPLEARTVVWGHSQGGHAALWTGIAAPRYAPDVGVIAIAALAPASDLAPLVAAAQDTVIGRIMSSFIVTAYSESYPDVRFGEYVAAPVRARGFAGRCLSGPGAVLSVVVAGTMRGTIFSRDPTTGPLGARLQANTPTEPIAVPVLLAQGTADALVLPEVQQAFVQRRCDRGQIVEYHSFGGRDHLGLVAPDSPLNGALIAWTRDRLAGVPSPNRCVRVDR